MTKRASTTRVVQVFWLSLAGAVWLLAAWFATGCVHSAERHGHTVAINGSLR